MEAKQKGISKTKDFKYPPILPIVYYEGKEAWTAQMELKDRIVGSDIFSVYVPNYRYHLIRADDYSKEELIAKEDELSFVMLIHQLHSVEDFGKLQIPEDFLSKISQSAPEDVLEVLSKVITVLLREINMPEDEVLDFTDKIKGTLVPVTVKKMLQIIS